MLLSIYITLTILAFVLFGLALLLGHNMNRLGTGEAIGTTKKGQLITYLLLSMILFIIISLSSMYIEMPHCENQILNQTISGNTTTFTNNIDCISNIYTSEALTGIYGFMVILCILFFFYYALAKE